MSPAEMWLGLILAIVVVLATTANVAIRVASRVRLAELLEQRGKPDLVNRLLAVRHDLLVGTSFVRLASVLGIVLLISHVSGTGPQGGSQWHYFLVFITSLVIIMIVGVAIPNAWARYASEPFLIIAAPVLFALRYVLWPLTALQKVVDALIRRLVGVPRSGLEDLDAEQIEKEILTAVSEGELTGAVHEADADMIESVMKFRETDVGEIMTPRTDIKALPDTCSLVEAKEFIAREGHSRIPVFGKDIDDIKGVLYAKDLLRLGNNDSFNPVEIMRKVPFVPETKVVADLLQELRLQKVHLAIVLDEYGGVAGLVTIEDILEEIVGEIADEYEAPEPEPILRIDDRTIEIDARVHIDELNEELNVDLPEDEDYDTVGGFVFSELGKIPTTGEQLSYGNVKISVLDAEERRINRLRIELVPDEAPA